MRNKTLNEYLEQLKIYVQQSNYSDSIDLLKNAISQYPDENKLKLNLGNIYKLLDQNDDAINIWADSRVLNSSQGKDCLRRWVVGRRDDCSRSRALGLSENQIRDTDH